MSKILMYFLVFGPCFVILSISVEGMFYVAYSMTLLCWIEVESSLRNAQPSKPENAQVYRFQVDDLRIVLFFLFFVQVGFFGTGNLASISLIPIFNPFYMSPLLLFKIIAPYIILSVIFATLTYQLHLPRFALFLNALMITDVQLKRDPGMTVMFFFNVTDTGSWLEIGQTISFFVVASLLLAWSGEQYITSSEAAKGAGYSKGQDAGRSRTTVRASLTVRDVYANGKAVIIRDLNNTTVARISPSGYYCASADAVGTVRVWDTVGEDQILKGEYKVISGCINDLEWDGESKRIIAVGDGREKFGHVFMMDTGSSTGEIIGHSKAINAVSIRHQRPFRAATAADDNLIVFHQGAPYKYDKTIKTHTKFVQDVRYAPSGDHFASVGSDTKIFIYDGKTGKTSSEFTDSPHKGTIMACSWSADSKSIVTSPADCTVKLWDVETRKSVTAWTVGSSVTNQQVGNTWSAENGIVSLSLGGDLNVFDPRVGNKSTRTFTAPQKAITAISPSSAGTLLAASGESTSLKGEGHSNFVTALATSSPDGKVFSVGPASLSTASQPKGIAVVEDSSVFVAEVNTVEVIRSNQKVFEITPRSAPTTVAATGKLVAVGGEERVVLYDWDGKSLKEGGVLEGNKGAISALDFSPDGKYLASGDSSGRIALFNVAEKKLVTSRWSFHSARVNSLSWTADSKHCTSGFLDTHVYIWSVKKPMKNIALKNVGPGGVSGVLWIDSGDGKTGKLVSAGADDLRNINSGIVFSKALSIYRVDFSKGKRERCINFFACRFSWCKTNTSTLQTKILSKITFALFSTPISLGS
ncbi:WD40 repeat-like protein [Armillaria gallica]|uniref:WD40 repeat-like protein n=1 Tax=Armillaria gallica TaxID=47427 RepID=A0A2H3D3F2_ARMGA|nr:WD40 repeat-like protein [Armillaria gallica]